jgi:hypothetical protein
MKKHASYRSEVLDGAPLRYAPHNELGVVFLFAHLAKKWRLRVDTIQPGFPDCIAFQKIQGKERRIRIEFEFKSKNFKAHKHDARKCDWLVCWEHNWPDAPLTLNIVELRREFGLGFNVWIVPVKEPYKEILAEIPYSDLWSVPSQAHAKDLILFYFTIPETHIAHLFVLKERARKVKADWKPGKDYMAPINRVCRPKAPIFFEDLKRHKILSTAPFVRGRMQGRYNASEYWPYLYKMIIQRNPSLKQKLKKFAPENI